MLIYPPAPLELVSDALYTIGLSHSPRFLNLLTKIIVRLG